jgi:hypothetical protein
LDDDLVLGPVDVTVLDAQHLALAAARFDRADDAIPALQRFISEDPADFAGGLNLYAYVGNRPLDLTDPLGLMTAATCAKWRQTIKNLKESIARREHDLIIDKLKLPEACFGDWDTPSLSKRGHRRLISDDKVNLAVYEVLLSLFCGGNNTPGTPRLLPEMPPIPVPPPPTPQQQAAIALVGATILTYWWVVLVL